MAPIEQILAQHFSAQSWHITVPESGRQKEAYIVQGEADKLLLKFTAALPGRERLAVLGVAPPLLAKGTFGGRPYVIQRFVEGVQPDRAWFARHLAELAHFFRRFHGDRPLAEMLAPARPRSPSEQIAHEVMALEEALAAHSAADFAGGRFRIAFRQFRAQARLLPSAPLVPVHGDPSPANMLVSRQGLVMVDWDGLTLSAPLHDLGPVAWWYLAQHKWPAFFHSYGTPPDRNGIFWWAARRSLEVALWFDARQDTGPARAFLADFYGALQQQPNPQVT